jgi:NAD+ synthase (glutamine-hydrolysing)
VQGRVARRNGLPLVYFNCVGGQGELVFDGGSLVLDRAGRTLYRVEQFAPTRFCVDIETAPARP